MFILAEICIGGCGNPSCDQKRAAKASEGGVRWWYLKLESESDPFDSDEPESLKNESLWSVQLQETGNYLWPHQGLPNLGHLNELNQISGLQNIDR
jgi:hypothetical protein